MSAVLAERVGGGGNVTAVDVADDRVTRDGYDFIRVEGVCLPFPDQSFDVVVSNHVIEHVGNREEQIMHLSEIARVMRPNALGYLAVPNRWALREPHFRLWFLSWLPVRLRNAYVRLAGKGRGYDCEPPGPLQIRHMFRAAALHYQDVTWSAIRPIGEIEGDRLAQRIGRYISGPVLQLLAPVYPTMVFLLDRRSPVHHPTLAVRA